MAEIIGIRFKNMGKVYYFDPAGSSFQKGDHVVVETARGMECGEVVIPNKQVSDETIVRPLKPVLRAASPEDLKRARENAEREQKAMRICQEKIAAHKLDMKLVDVEYTFDSSKILFYFTADGRVDFRELVKDLASVFRTRIELRQIGVRDEVSACAADRSAAARSSAAFSRSPSKWRRSRAYPSTLPKFRAPAAV